MNHISQALRGLGISMHSSDSEIRDALQQVRVFRYDFEYVKDFHYQQYIVPLNIQTMEDVHTFLDGLDAVAREQHSGDCTKAYVARHWLKTEPESIDKLRWAAIGLSRARRTNCGCHQNYSFNLSNRFQGHQ